MALVALSLNGMVHRGDGSDTGRYIVEHLTWLSRAIREGADVRGYFYWSFMDNYEWNQWDDLAPRSVRGGARRS